ncbi:O-acetyl-ADP-ribose deacetylase [Membranicola marinus]|uniref:O-acetyl-ADP-ribose deacetylase n=1 Tax=Membranihabitans marinus TaxID=1227546 RepID=A0A953LCV5_9BACT|nr:O-acetyl-ADP-ribose deacetylase [Membranihabitans marinus]MBY5958184.1 O-acetyl-ADP-ribose deacetylase [Membranihabitans marinus]
MEIIVQKGDITKVKADAIVNAANSSLLGGGGVDGAIHRAGGPAILEACKKIREKQGECPPGEAVITTAGDLDARYVIHTVGPVWKGGGHDEANLLRKCYENSLALAEANELTSIAFPNIATGVYNFPKAKAAHIALDVVRNTTSDYLKTVYFVCFGEDNYELYLKA